MLVKILYRFTSVKNQINELRTPYGNVTDKISSFIGRDLYKQQNHPLGIIKNEIELFFKNELSVKQKMDNKTFQIFDSFNPIVTTKQNFDDLLVPQDHISRKRSDTYYINETQLLRTHTSAYQKGLIENKNDAFLVFADVYRRDEIDSTHYPVFHQMEGVRIFKQEKSHHIEVHQVVDDLQNTCERLVRKLFGEVQMRWVPAYFPFTDPSLELEIYYENRWLEMLGCGVIHQNLMDNAKRHDEIGWALGLGLERFAMLLFNIPDIRLFWSEDERFKSQFKAGKISKFQAFSKYPSCYKDVTFFIPPTFEENDLYELVRDHGGDLIEKVECVDTFINKKNNLVSKSYRIFYRSLERTLQNQEVKQFILSFQIDDLQMKIRGDIKNKLKLELR